MSCANVQIQKTVHDNTLSQLNDTMVTQVMENTFSEENPEKNCDADFVDKTDYVLDTGPQITKGGANKKEAKYKAFIKGEESAEEENVGPITTNDHKNTRSLKAKPSGCQQCPVCAQPNLPFAFTKHPTPKSLRKSFCQKCTNSSVSFFSQIFFGSHLNLFFLLAHYFLMLSLAILRCCIHDYMH